MKEIWKDIPGYEGRYQVSNMGRVRSLTRLITQISRSGRPFKRVFKGRILKQFLSKSGYPIVTLGGERRSHQAHQLVMRAFVGPQKAEEEVRHLNGNGVDNRLENLAYGSPSENALDLYKYKGRIGKLTPDKVLKIRAEINSGIRQIDIAKKYGIAQRTVSKIKLKQVYAWLL